jgi:hypothetical protein
MTAALTSDSIVGSRGLAGDASSTDSEMDPPRGFLGNHTYSCALPVRGGVCDCQSDHNPAADPWPHLSTAKINGRGAAQRRSSRAA